jgi:tetratricopeptide (TPR) repeat protein
MKINNRVWLLLILLVTSVIYFQTLKHDFVNWDDATYIQNNELIKDLSVEGIKKNFNTPEVNSTYIPITIFTWAIDYKIGGGNSFQYHFTNLIFHLMNIVLVFVLISKLFKNKRIPIVVSMLFAFHPMNVEVVSWLSARKDLVYVFFFLLSVISYTTWRKTTNNRFYILALAMFLLSLFSKGAAITLPFVLILIDYLFNQLSKKSLLNKIPFFALSLLFGIIGLSGQNNTGATTNLTDLSIINRVANGFTNYLTFIVKSLFPVKISPFHPQLFTSNTDFPTYLYISIPLFILGLVFLYKKFKNNKQVIFGMMFFLITILPVIQFLSFGMAQYGERYAYLPYIGLFVIIALVFNKIIEKKKTKRVTYLVVISYIIFLVVVSYNNTKAWKNGETLWTAVIHKYTEAQIGYNNKADFYRKQGQIDKAIELYNDAILIADKPYLSYNQLGFLYNNQRKYDLAIQVLNKSISINGNYAGSYLNRGVSNLNIGRLDLALADFNKTLSVNPNVNAAYYNRGYTYKMKGDIELALNDFLEYVLYDKQNYRAFERIGEIYLDKNENSLAYQNAIQCINLNESCINCVYIKGTVQLRNRDFEKALGNFNLILKQDNKHLKSHLNKGVCLMNLGKFELAIKSFNDAVALKPKWGLIYYNRSIAYEKIGEYNKAKNDIELAKQNGYLFI